MKFKILWIYYSSFHPKLTTFHLKMAESPKPGGIVETTVTFPQLPGVPEDAIIAITSNEPTPEDPVYVRHLKKMTARSVKVVSLKSAWLYLSLTKTQSSIVVLNINLLKIHLLKIHLLKIHLLKIPLIYNTDLYNCNFLVLDRIEFFFLFMNEQSE